MGETGRPDGCPSSGLAGAMRLGACNAQNRAGHGDLDAHGEYSAQASWTRPVLMHCDPATQAKKRNPGDHSYMVPRGMGPTLVNPTQVILQHLNSNLDFAGANCHLKCGPEYQNS